MSSTSFNEPRRAPPRHHRMGGFVISHEVAAQWAERLLQTQLDRSRDSYSIRMAVLEKTYPHRINFRRVGEVLDIEWMLITQSERFSGYKDMDPAKIPQFKPCEKDGKAEQLLKEAGIEEYKFATVLD